MVSLIRTLLLIALSAVIFGLSTVGLHSQSRQPTFINLCAQRSQLPSAEQHTIAQLLDVAGTTDCQAAHDSLLSKTRLELQDHQMTNLQPLAYFPQLESLYLDHNQITDLSPLASLPQLRELYLLGNQITDLSPLAPLNNLSTLYLDNNNIRDLSPLSSLDALTTLYANSNRIDTLAPLANLPNLTQLYVADNQIDEVQVLRSHPQLTHLNLGHNRITEITPLAALTRLAELDLSENRITRLDALAPLSQLTSLDIRNNPLTSKTCPIFPATICLFSDDAADLTRLGENQRQQENFTAALETFKSALDIYRQGDDRLRESNTLDRIGNLYDDLGQYANALDIYQQAANIRQAVGDRQGEGDTLTNLGITYIRLGQTEKALVSLQQALAIQQELTPKDRPEPRSGKILSSLALAYSRLENPTEALRYAKLSLANYRSRVNNDRFGEAIALNRVGEAYLQLGNLDKARLYLEKALNFSQTQDDRPSLAHSLHNLGDLSLRQGEPAAALEHYQQARQLWQNLGDPAGEGDTLNAIGELYLQTGQADKATTVLQTTVALWESLRPGLTDENKISIAETQAHTYRMLQEALIDQNRPETALEVSERNRARAFAELLAHRLTLQGKSLPPAQLQSPSVDQIQTIARAQQATLVEYSLMPTELFIWVVEPTGTIHFRRQSLEVRSLPDTVQDNRLALGVRSRGARFGNSGFAASLPSRPAQAAGLRQLYQWLIQPIADLLPAEAPLVIIPQAELFLVPFPALEDKNGTLLIAQHPLRFAPAIGLLRSAQAAQPSLPIDEVPALVVGNPVMPADPDTGSPLPPLTGAEQEALTIAPLLNTQPLIQETATKTAVVSQMDRAKIAHFATHGLLDDFGTGIPGALALTPTDDDSGFLTAAEILNLPLAARMVVLSACNTGRGKITGDGVVGLSRSFLTAGVESVIVSLWEVPDEATTLLMTEFYRQLQQQPNRAIALQQAMLTTRDRYEHPSNWAAFALFGEMGG